MSIIITRNKITDVNLNKNNFSATNNGEHRADGFASKAYDIGEYFQKLSAGQFFGSSVDRQDLGSIYKALKNIKPAVGVIVANMIHMMNQQDPTGMKSTGGNAETCGRIAEDFVLQAMNFPATKATLCAILKKLLLNCNKMYTNNKKIVSGKRHSIRLHH